ncbi:hypothetical protein QE152_g34788 [Popillia japonica]|uniref:Transposase n=1 Tax=Popillia japonica TaxID=7064 RepID=A0AAW1ITN8_POPJA
MPVLNQVKEACQKIPFEEHISCDEQIIPFKGRTSLKTYNPKNAHKWGYRINVTRVTEYRSGAVQIRKRCGFGPSCIAAKSMPVLRGLSSKEY